MGRVAINNSEKKRAREQQETIMRSTDKEIDELDHFLTYHDSEDSLLLSGLDGFLTSIIVCPDMIVPSEWIPVIWGGVEPEFDTSAQAQKIMGTIMDLFNSIIDDLNQDGCRPLFEQNKHGFVFWDDWIEGFWTAVRMRPGAWKTERLKQEENSDNDDIDKALFVLISLRSLVEKRENMETETETDKELDIMATELIPESIQTLHHTRLAQHHVQNTPTMAPQFMPSPFTSPANENNPKVGRNDPCPCGSGKKFKKCCLK